MGQVHIVGVAALLLIASSDVAFSATPKSDLVIDVGGIQLELGMPQDDALARLATLYDLRHQDSAPGNWTVVRRGGPSYDFLGSLSFQDGKLAFVTRSWDSLHDQTTNDLALALHRALKSLPAGQARTCIISTSVTGIVVDTTLQCGRRKFSILASTDGSTTASINETISLDR